MAGRGTCSQRRSATQVPDPSGIYPVPPYCGAGAAACPMRPRAKRAGRSRLRSNNVATATRVQTGKPERRRGSHLAKPQISWLDERRPPGRTPTEPAGSGSLAAKRRADGTVERTARIAPALRVSDASAAAGRASGGAGRRTRETAALSRAAGRPPAPSASLTRPSAVSTPTRASWLALVGDGIARCRNVVLAGPL
jgi:hypothetical protein